MLNFNKFLYFNHNGGPHMQNLKISAIPLQHAINARVRFTPYEKNASLRTNSTS